MLWFYNFYQTYPTAMGADIKSKKQSYFSFE